MFVVDLISSSGIVTSTPAVRWSVCVPGGRELPEDTRQRVTPTGELKIAGVQKSSDAGVYTCWARNKQGQSARRSGEVAVIGM